MRFTLSQPNKIRGAQLLAEIKAALGTNSVVCTAYPPNEVEIIMGADAQGKPIEPTSQQAATITATIAAHTPNLAYFPEEQDAAQARQTLLAAAQSAVGVAVADLTTVQMRALLGVLLYVAGGLDKDTKVKPLAQWVRS